MDSVAVIHCLFQQPTRVNAAMKSLQNFEVDHLNNKLNPSFNELLYRGEGRTETYLQSLVGLIYQFSCPTLRSEVMCISTKRGISSRSFTSCVNKTLPWCYTHMMYKYRYFIINLFIFNIL